MATGKSKQNRRKGVRRAVRGERGPWFAWLRQRDVGWCLLFVAAFAIVGSAIALSARGRPGHYLGQMVDQPVLARQGFEAIDLKATERERAFNRREVPPVFRHSDKLRRDLKQELTSLLKLHEVDFEEISPDYVTSVDLTPEAHAQLRRYALGVGDSPATPEAWDGRVRDALRRIFTHVILNDGDYRRTAALDEGDQTKVIDAAKEPTDD